MLFHLPAAERAGDLKLADRPTDYPGSRDMQFSARRPGAFHRQVSRERMVAPPDGSSVHAYICGEDDIIEQQRRGARVEREATPSQSLPLATGAHGDATPRIQGGTGSHRRYLFVKTVRSPCARPGLISVGRASAGNIGKPSTAGHTISGVAWQLVSHWERSDELGDKISRTRQEVMTRRVICPLLSQYVRLLVR